MKVLIWILCIFANALITTLLKEADVGLGAIPTIALFGATIWLARTLCKKWDEAHEDTRQMRILEREQAEAAERDRVRFCRKCGEKLPFDNKFCLNCGTETVEISSNSNTGEDDFEFCKKCGANITDDIDICHVCGEPKGEK